MATWNIWWKFGPWADRQEPIAAELASVDPDVCCLQEVWADDDHDQAFILGNRLNRHVARTTSESGAPHRFGNAVLSRWRIAEHRTIVLPGFDGEPGHRSALFCRIEVPDAPHAWWVVSTHLEWRYTASRLRQRQLEAVVSEAARIRAADSDAIVVLGGDFNAVADSTEIRRLTGLAEPYDHGSASENHHDHLVFTDAWEAVGDGPGHTWTRDNSHSANAQWPRRRLDAIFVSWPRPKPTGNPLTADLFGIDAHPTRADHSHTVVPSDHSHTVVPSDHYGVVVELDRRTPGDLEAGS